MGIEMTVNGRRFLQKTHLSMYVRKLLKRNDLGVLSGEDLGFMLDLLTYHYDYKARFAGKVRAIEVEIAPLTYGRSKRFCAHLSDGTREPFSWQKCLSAPTNRSKVMTALRGAVSDQIVAFARAQFDAPPVLCALTGEVLTPEMAHVDHAHPRTFCALAEKWAIRRGLNLDTLPVVPVRGVLQQYRLEEALSEDFAAFHGRWCCLRMVKAEENCRRGDRG